jgi:threonine dehydrogenase-like Zn-dependent dehydrogenase
MRTVAAVGGGKLGMLEISRPEVTDPFECLVRMDACAICNSTDIKLLKNEFCPGPFPTILGHEVIGTVIEVGEKAGNFREGDRVFRQRLEDRHVPEGRSTWGGFAEYGIVVDQWARDGVPYLHHTAEYRAHPQQKLALDIEPALATGMVTLMETLDYVQGCGAAPGKAVAIVGTGPVGQSFALFAKLLGAGPVIAFGRRAVYAERFAKIARADEYVAGRPYPSDVKRRIAAGGFNIVIEAVGSRQALDTCLELAGEQGAVCCYGVASESEPYTETQLADPRLRAVDVLEGRAQAQLVEYVEAGHVRLEDWVSHTLPMREYQKAFDQVVARQSTKMALLP